MSIDSGIAHLAGALGQNVELALDKVPDFRWTIDGQTTPWYVNHRIHRRQPYQTMSEVFLEATHQAVKRSTKKVAPLAKS